MFVDRNDLIRYFSELGEEEKRVLILGHPHADPDAVGSVKALGEILESLGVRTVTGIPQNLSKLSNSVLDSLDEDISIDPVVDSDVVIILDTSSLDQLKEYEEKIESLNPEIVFIDHHRADEETLDRIDKYYGEEKISSTAELVLEIGEELNYEFKPKTALLLLTGIISDTGHLKFANENTFKAIASLLEKGANYKEALEILKTPQDPSKKVAMLKAAQRSELQKVHNRWIVFSEIGAYESDAASLFIKIGADVAVVASENGEKIRMSGRSKSGLASETNLHLGELMSKIADQFDGTGGGHAGAAAVTVTEKLEKVKKTTMKEIKKMLKPA